QLANQLTYPVVYLAVLAAGRTVFPLHPALTEYEVQEAAAKANADRVICEQALGLTKTTIAPHVVRAWMQDPINKGDRRKPSGTGAGSMLLQSSGTTGLPKIAERSAGSIDAVARNVARAVGLDQQDQVIAAIPLCHSYGIENGLVGPLLAGACVYACPGFDPGVISGLWSSLDRVVVPAVPIMIDLLASAEDLPLPGDRLRRVYSAGAALPASVSDRFLERFGKRVGQLYGATEIGSVTFGHADASALAPGCVGEAMDGVSIRVVDLDQPAITLPPGEQGQVAIRAPSMLDRYLGDEDLPIVAGHYLTGDLGKLGPDGALSITGRIKALIEVGGMKVNAMEVERVLAEHPGVNECVVVPVRITETLSRLTAFVLPVDPDAPPPTASLRRHARGRLAAYKVPRAFEVVDQLPRSSLGKVQRRRLMETRA
ncbi:MAG: fatty acid--CoA ligase family protein, partial [Planctomycetota bacterium]